MHSIEYKTGCDAADAVVPIAGQASADKNSSAGIRRGISIDKDWGNITARYVTSLRFGAVRLVVEDSKVVGIEFARRVRFRTPNSRRH